MTAEEEKPFIQVISVLWLCFTASAMSQAPAVLGAAQTQSTHRSAIFPLNSGNSDKTAPRTNSSPKPTVLLLQPQPHLIQKFLL